MAKPCCSRGTPRGSTVCPWVEDRRARYRNAQSARTSPCRRTARVFCSIPTRLVSSCSAICLTARIRKICRSGAPSGPRRCRRCLRRERHHHHGAAARGGPAATACPPGGRRANHQLPLVTGRFAPGHVARAVSKRPRAHHGPALKPDPRGHWPSPARVGRRVTASSLESRPALPAGIGHSILAVTKS